MKNRYYKTPYVGSAFSDFDGVLRYIRAKDYELINKDDPDFFAMPPDGKDQKMQQQSPHH